MLRGGVLGLGTEVLRRGASSLLPHTLPMTGQESRCLGQFAGQHPGFFFLFPLLPREADPGEDVSEQKGSSLSSQRTYKSWCLKATTEKI